MKEYANKYTESRRLQIHAEQPEFFDFGPYPHSTGLKRRVRVRQKNKWAITVQFVDSANDNSRPSFLLAGMTG